MKRLLDFLAFLSHRTQNDEDDQRYQCNYQNGRSICECSHGFCYKADMFPTVLCCISPLGKRRLDFGQSFVKIPFSLKPFTCFLRVTGMRGIVYSLKRRRRVG